MDHESAGPFRYRKSVRAIAVTDACIAFFMLTLFALKCQMDFCSALLNETPNILMVITLIVFGIYALQLIMAQVLMTATYQHDITIVLSRCQKWYWTSQFLHVILGIELFVVVFSIRGGTPFAFTICVMKIVFRAVANHLVKMFMWDLRTSPPAYPFIATISNPFPPRPPPEFTSHGGGSGMGMGMQNYEPPPSYEEAIKDKIVVEDFVLESNTNGSNPVTTTESLTPNTTTTMTDTLAAGTVNPVTVTVTTVASAVPP